MHEPTLRDAIRAVTQARISVPTFGAWDPRTIQVVVFENNYGRIRTGKITRDAPKVRTVTVNGHPHRFDPRTGELLGTPFAPFAMHLKQQEHSNDSSLDTIRHMTLPTPPCQETPATDA